MAKSLTPIARQVVDPLGPAVRSVMKPT